MELFGAGIHGTKQVKSPSLYESFPPGIPELFLQLMQKYPRCLGLQSSPLKSPIISRERLDVYTEEGYKTMTQDRPRNDVYRGAIKRAVDGGYRNFLEIGCGGDACLTRMVLDNPGTTITALEGNENAANAAAITLMLQDYNESRFDIRLGLSTSSSLDDFFLGQAGGKVRVVLQEVLGFIASREGVVPVFRDLQQRLGFGSWGAIPSHCATFFTPTFVQMGEVRHNLTHGMSLLGSLGGFEVDCSQGIFGEDGEGERKGSRAFSGLSTESDHSERNPISTPVSSPSTQPPCTLLSSPYLLVSRFPLRDENCPFWRPDTTFFKDGWGGTPICGALECLNLVQDIRTQVRQLRTTRFCATHASKINSLMCFIWVGFEPVLQKDASTADRRGGTGLSATRVPKLTRSTGRDPGSGGGTQYPYSTDLPPLRPNTHAFSSVQSDPPDNVAVNWPNLVLMLPELVTLEVGDIFEVQSWADLSGDPHIYG